VADDPLTSLANRLKQAAPELTLDQMKSAKPVTVGEIINDELPPWA